MNYLLLLIIFATSFFAQKKVRFEADIAFFKYSDSTSYLELYYSFDKESLTKIKDNGTVFLKGELDLLIYDSQTKEVYYNNKWAISENAGNLTGNRLVGQLSLEIPFKEYNIDISGKNFDKDYEAKSIKYKVTVPSFNDSKITISDLELATKIVRSNETKSLFYKNGFDVEANPAALYSKSNPVFYYYYEIYKNNSLDNCKSNLKILNSQKRVIYERKKNIKFTSNSICDIGLKNMLSFPTGAYYLNVEIKDDKDNLISAKWKKFFYYNPDFVDTTSNNRNLSNYLSSEFSGLSDAECDKHWSYAKYLASYKEKEEYSNLSKTEGKKEFLFNFWKRRDTDKSTAFNEFKSDYYNRLAYVNRTYTSNYKAGYKTDRGRVFLLYGKPDQIERFPSSSENVPYERWYYGDIEGGVEFVFADLRGFNYYELIHSTKRGEYQDYNWTKRINKAY